MKIQLTALMKLDSLLNDLGGDADDYLRPYQLTKQDLTNPDIQISLLNLVQILHQAASDFQCPDLGLRLGASQDFTLLGAAGKILLNSKTLLDALYAARWINTVHNHAEFWRPFETEHHIYFRRYDMFHQQHDTRQYKEMAMSACYRLGKLLIGESFREVKIEFSHRPLAEQSVYRKYFACQVKFNCEQDQLILPRHLATIAITQQAPISDQQISAGTLLRQDPNALPAQVSILIDQLMSSHQLSLAHIANKLSMSQRTLQRKLKHHNLEFRKLLETSRIEKACWYLTSSEIDMTLLSEMLGYRDLANFSRAFKRVKGVAPRKWRQQLQLI